MKKVDKLHYEDEDISLVAHILIAAFLIAAYYLCFVKSDIKEIDSKAVYIIPVGIMVYIVLSVLRSDISALRTREENYNIKKNGIRVNGFIKSFQTINISHGSTSNNSSTTTHYYLDVIYDDPYTHEMKKIKTPYVAFDPLYELGAKECGVYILDDKVYVSDFVESVEGDENVWARDNKVYAKRLEEEEKNSKGAKIVTIVFICIMIIGLLVGLNIE